MRRGNHLINFRQKYNSLRGWAWGPLWVQTSVRFYTKSYMYERTCTLCGFT